LIFHWVSGEYYPNTAGLESFSILKVIDHIFDHFLLLLLYYGFLTHIIDFNIRNQVFCFVQDSGIMPGLDSVLGLLTDRLSSQMTAGWPPGCASSVYPDCSSPVP